MALTLQKVSQDHLPGQSVDCVVFGFRKNQLQILLLKWKYVDDWGLPGGFIRKNESFDVAARRVLKDRTGLDNVYLKQFYTFGDASRRQASEVIDSLSQHLEPEDQHLLAFLKQRYVTTGYFALVQAEDTNLSTDIMSESCEWVALDEIPPLFLDHEAILSKALKTIRTELSHLPIGMQLLPKRFTLSQLKKIYEAILEEELDRGNFQRKMLKMGHLIRLEKQQSGAAHRAPYLYTFDKKNYNRLLGM